MFQQPSRKKQLINELVFQILYSGGNRRSPMSSTSEIGSTVVCPCQPKNLSPGPSYFCKSPNLANPGIEPATQTIIQTEEIRRPASSKWKSSNEAVLF
jgi:hypothetical protein